VELKLYTIPGSHPCHTAEAALALKQLPYERVDLLPGLSQFQQRARFGKRTVPGLEVDGYRVSGSRLILRTLDGLRPDPRLYPTDPERLAAVVEAERWGDADLQSATRWTILYALTRRPEAGDSFLAGANVPQLPAALSARVTKAVFGIELRLLGGGPSGTQRWLRELPALLDHADDLIERGVLGGDPPGAADLQIGASIALLLRLEDLRAGIEARPCGALARRLFPDYPGHVPAGALPADWIPSLAPRAPAAAG
jgi:glutathione S-transferase